jgi:hypothetical protein
MVTLENMSEDSKGIVKTSYYSLCILQLVTSKQSLMIQPPQKYVICEMCWPAGHHFEVSIMPGRPTNFAYNIIWLRLYHE